MVIVYLFSFQGVAEASIDANDQILVISSYSPVKEGGNHVISSFLEKMDSKVATKIAVEYMDSESTSDFSRWVAWMKSLISAYDMVPRMVVLIGGEVWSVYRECCPDSWRKIPIVLGGVKHGYIEYKNWQLQQVDSVAELPSFEDMLDGFNVTGYYLRDYIEENLLLIHRLQPEVTDVAFCYDDRYHHRFLKPYLQGLMGKIKGVRFHYWFGSKMTTENLVDSIASYDEKLALLSAGWYTDMKGYAHAYSMLQNELARLPDKLVYEVSDQDVNGYNYIGGYFISGKEIGTELADLAYQVMTKGIENSPAFGPTLIAPKYHLNYASFKRRNFDRQLVPDNTIWYNVPPTIWENYGKSLVIALVCSVFILIFIVFVLIYRWRREQYYIHSNRQLTQLLKVMPSMVIVFDQKINVIDIINPDQRILMGLEPDKLIGKHFAQGIATIPGFVNVGALIQENLEHVLQTREDAIFNYSALDQENEFFVEVRMVFFDSDKVMCFMHDVTSSVIAEKEIVKYKNFLQSVIDHLPLGITVKNVSDNYRYIYYNQEIIDFYENEGKNFLGKNDFEMDDPLAELYRQEDEQILLSDKPISYRREFVDSRGNTRWAVMTKVRLINNDGSRYIIAILVDITNDSKREMELENIRNELSIALDAGSLSVWVYDVQQRLFNSLYRETVAEQGLTLEQGYNIAYPEDREKYLCFMEELASGKCEKKKEIFRFFREGEYNWFETHAAGMRSTLTGEVVQVVGTEKNITNELKRQRELEESKFKIDFVIKSNGIVQWDYNIEKKMFSSPNQDSFMHKGVSYDSFMKLVHPDDRVILEQVTESLVSGVEESINIQIRANFHTEYRWFNIHAVVFKRDENGNVTQVTGLRSDITDLKQVMEELILLRDKAEESNRLKSAFLANMSHEIRTPLNAIVGFSELIAQTEDRAEIEEYCKVIENNNDLLLRLINDILDLSKIEAGQLEFAFSEVRLSQLFEGLFQIYRMKIPQEVELLCELPAEDCVILTEKNRITQIISNFLTNAAKFTSTGYIKMGYEHIDNGIRFYVSDTGKGIAPENIPHVFERFMKFDSFVQGTGLGLSICQTIIERLGGKIGVDSELGKGSTFWFIIPVSANISDISKPRY